MWDSFEKSSTAKVNKHLPCAYSMSTVLTFHGIGNMHDFLGCENAMRTFCEYLRESAKDN